MFRFHDTLFIIHCFTFFHYNIFLSDFFNNGYNVVKNIDFLNLYTSSCLIEFFWGIESGGHAF